MARKQSRGPQQNEKDVRDFLVAQMRIEIFEIRGSSEISTDLDMLILDTHKRRQNIILKKIDVFNKEQMKAHKDIVEMIKKDGIEILPIIKADGKIVSEQRLHSLLRKN